MNVPTQGAQGALPPGVPDPSEAFRERTVLMVFAAVLAVSCGTFLILALSGTTADPLGGPVCTGLYDWNGLAKGLPPVQENLLPRIFRRVGEGQDPMEWDSLPGGRPDPELLPPEIPTEATEEVSQEEIDAALEVSRIEAEQRRVRKEALDLMEQGDQLLRSNRYPQAKEIYVQAAKIDPSFKRAIAGRFFKKAKDQEQKRSWSRAKLLYRMALHFDYENSKLHQALAATSQALGDKRKAEEHERLAEKFAAQGK